MAECFSRSSGASHSEPWPGRCAFEDDPIQLERTEVIPLDGLHAQAVGAQLGQTLATDTADAHIVICARMAGYANVTSEPLDLKRLAPKFRLIRV